MLAALWYIRSYIISRAMFVRLVLITLRPFFPVTSAFSIRALLPHTSSFRRVRVSREKRLLAFFYVCPAVCLSVFMYLVPRALYKIVVKFYAGDFYENVPKNPNLFTFGQKYRAFRMKTEVGGFVCWRHEMVKAPQFYVTRTLPILFVWIVL